MRNESNEEPDSSSSCYPLSLAEYQRYGRQMILPRFGLQGQIKLRDARVLVVGAGGLGCPAVQYLAAAGVGHISIIDHDLVESSNLARQILHNDEKVGMNKALSAAKAAQVINPLIRLEAIEESFTVQNAVSLISKHDLVLDCTDNVLTRYLISDAAVLNGVQVVSGAAQGLEGQLVVLHRDLRLGAFASGSSQQKSKIELKRGPCYRCLFPKAPRPEDVTDCEDGGVLGGVTGMVGTMQAVEAIKLLVGMSEEEEQPHLTLVTPFNYPPFRTIKLRPQRITTCRACGDPNEMKEEERKTKLTFNLSGEDYVAFCGLDRLSEKMSDLMQVDVLQLSEAIKADEIIIVDVRPQVEYEIAHLSSSINIPFRKLQSEPQFTHDHILNLVRKTNTEKGHASVYLLCRKGNDSLLAQRTLTQLELPSSPRSLQFVNVKGGLRAWSEKVDCNFPIY